MSVRDSRDLDVDVVAWALAVGLFFVGDLATTAWGLRLGYVEANPAMALALGDVSIAKLAVAKALGLGDRPEEATEPSGMGPADT